MEAELAGGLGEVEGESTAEAAVETEEKGLDCGGLQHGPAWGGAAGEGGDHVGEPTGIVGIDVGAQVGEGQQAETIPKVRNDMVIGEGGSSFEIGPSRWRSAEPGGKVASQGANGVRIAAEGDEEIVYMGGGEGELDGGVDVIKGVGVGGDS